jgi:hypothetical protein
VMLPIRLLPRGNVRAHCSPRDASKNSISINHHQTTSKMLAIQKSKIEAQKCTPNLLPCKINHDGPVNASERYWKPEVEDGRNIPEMRDYTLLIIADGSRTAYFRGRKLEGKVIKVPEGYRGWSLFIFKEPLSNLF